jgi:hypothetical protein
VSFHHFNQRVFQQNRPKAVIGAVIDSPPSKL